MRHAGAEVSQKTLFDNYPINLNIYKNCRIIFQKNMKF